MKGDAGMIEMCYVNILVCDSCRCKFSDDKGKCFYYDKWLLMTDAKKARWQEWRGGWYCPKCINERLKRTKSNSKGKGGAK